MPKKIIILAACILIASAAVFAVFMSVKTTYVVPILMYHSIDQNYKSSKLSVSPESFARQMEFLRKNHYNVVPLEKVIPYLEKREKPPVKTIAVTLDDGYENNYQIVYPILKKYNIPATIFIIINRVGAPGFVTWEQIKEMSDSGLVTIGSHTKVHFWLLNSDKSFLDEEIVGSKKILEEKLGRPVNAFCYPMGSFDEASKKAVRDAGYLCAVSTNPPGVSPDDIYAIRRVKVSRSSDSMLGFWIKTTRAYTWSRKRK